jgi:Holliday junction resolvase RusA-like endonuclease
MRASFAIDGRMPGLNDYVLRERSNRFAGAAMKRAQTDRAAAAARGLPAFHGPVTVSFTWVEKNRRRDPDNVAFAKKFVLDGLVRAGVIENDSPRYVRGLSDRFECDPARPRVEVEVASA